MKTGGDTSERQARKRKTCERERERRGRGQSTTQSGGWFILFFLSFLGLEKEEASPTSASEKRKKERVICESVLAGA